MSRNRQRVDRLTTLAGVREQPTPGLVVGALPDAVWRAARSKAERRRRHAHGCHEGWDDVRRQRVHDDGLPAVTTREDIRAELVDLDTRIRSCGDLHVALRGWCDEADAQGWPPSLLGPDTYVQLRTRLRRDEGDDHDELARLGLDWSRGLDVDDWRFASRSDGRVVSRRVVSRDTVRMRDSAHSHPS